MMGSNMLGSVMKPKRVQTAGSGSKTMVGRPGTALGLLELRGTGSEL